MEEIACHTKLCYESAATVPGKAVYFGTYRGEEVVVKFQPQGLYSGKEAAISRYLEGKTGPRIPKLKYHYRGEITLPAGGESIDRKTGQVVDKTSEVLVFEKIDGCNFTEKYRMITDIEHKKRLCLKLFKDTYLLHRLGVTHSDLVSNILLDAEENIYFIDFERSFAISGGPLAEAEEGESLRLSDNDVRWAVENELHGLTTQFGDIFAINEYAAGKFGFDNIMSREMKNTFQRYNNMPYEELLEVEARWISEIEATLN